MESDNEETQDQAPKNVNLLGAPSSDSTIKKSCRFFGMPGGCAHGENCHYVHERDGKRTALGSKRCIAPPMVRTRKILVSGLPSSLESGELYHILAGKFGPVLDAIVIPAGSSDDKSESGGIGIVTFKSVDSVFAAIQARHINILGKKVLIEGRSAFTGTARQSSSISGSSSGTNSVRTDKELPAKEPLTPIPLHGDFLPAWIYKFKKWLPKFLEEASIRTKGEAYPLCSLKGDFRATCGSELDHISLGYEKLADFLRAMPEIVTLKTVPVGGTGPAMHIVLERGLGTQPQGEQAQVSQLIDAIKLQQAQHSSPLSVAASQALEMQPQQVQVPMGFVKPSEHNNNLAGLVNVPVFYIGSTMYANLPGGLTPLNIPGGALPAASPQPAVAASANAEWGPFQNWQLPSANANESVEQLNLSWEAFVNWQKCKGLYE